jgi:threonylcarbamoyladenosine tRNA methylthiotransferase MtaB
MSSPIRLLDKADHVVTRPRFAICTLGCKLNQADESDLRRELRSAGLAEVPFSEPADVYIVNTCTVTHLADRRSRQMLRRAKRRNSNAVVAAIGCYPQVSPDELEAMPEVDLLVDSINKLTVVDDILDQVGTAHQAFDLDISVEPGAGDRTRRMVKIQEGCRAHCTYCVIPKARGAPQNTDPANVVEQIRAAEQEGFREVVLTGTHVGTYKWKPDSQSIWRLPDLLEYVLQETSIPRVRVTSVGPHEIDSRFIEILRHPRMMPHLHMALQSGSATVLRRMKRWYNLQQFLRSIRYLREAIPDIGLTTDVIVGFPGETDEEFLETLAFAEEMSFSDMHIFPFSARRDTPAAEMTDFVNHQVKEERCARLRELGKRLADQFTGAMVGEDMTVLLEGRVVEDEQGNRFRGGLSGNYVRVYVPESEATAENRIVDVTALEPFRDGLRSSHPAREL